MQTTNFPPMERDAFQVYKRHMQPKGYGHPLWIPQSNMRLPVPYRQTGVCIGDVGIITREGAFDCLFNICLPRDHPINSHVPDNFEPLLIPLSHRPILEYRSFSWGAYLASDDIHANQAHLNGMHFVTSAPEGAILTMPRGAHFQRLANPCQFDNYIAANAESWYRFVNGRLLRGADNGDLRIVTGCHKSTVWGMATVFNSSQYTTQSHSLRFNALQPPHPYSANLLYFWEVSGSVLAKVGPEAGDNDDLLDHHHGHELRNQCLFVNSHSVSIRPEIWSKFTPKNSISDKEEANNSFESMQGLNAERDPGEGETTFTSGDYSTSVRGYDAVALQSDTPPLDIVPDHTKAINKILLQQDPDVRVAITDDNEWCMVLGKDDPAKVKSSDLYSRILRLNNIRRRNDGLVHFELKDRNPDLWRILHLGYFSTPNSSKSGPTSETLHPFLMEHPEDLFVFDGLLEASQVKIPDSVLSPLDHFTKSQLYQELDSSTLSDASRALGDAAWNGYLQFNRPRDLDEAIWLYEEAVSLTPSLVPLFGLCSALYRRFFVNRNLRDLVHLARYIRRQEMLNLDEIIDQLASQTASQTDHSPKPNGQVSFLKLKPRNSEQPTEWNNILAMDENTVGGSGVRIYSINLFTRILKRFKSLSSSSDEEFPSPEPSAERASHMKSKFQELLELTVDWVIQKDSHFYVLWFYGPSATTMVESLVEQLPGSGIESYVISTFNFSDKAAWNNEVYELFPAIAVELAFRVPGLLEHYMSVPRERDQQLMDSSLGIQFWGLIVDPLRKLLPCQNSNHIPTTIMINNIDNCGYKTARIIINLITEALVMFSLPLRFIITSNKNPRIQDVFDGPLLSKVSRQFFVGTQASNAYPNAVYDPSEILRRASIPIPPDALKTLVERSRGSSVYAETLLRFIGTVGEDPIARLSYVLEPAPTLRPGQALTAAFADLDSLFTKILSTHHDRNALVHALGILLVLHDCAQPQTIAQNIFGLLPRSEFFSSVLNVLQSLMHLPKVDNENHAHPWLAVMTKVPNKDQRALKSPYLVLPFLSLSTAITTAYTIPLAFRDRVHDSFYDFLVNPERSGPFHIDINYFHGQVAMRGFAFITHQLWRDWRPPKVSDNISRSLDLRNVPTFSPETWDYLKFHLPDHYAQCSDTIREQIMEQLQDALKAALYSEKDSTHADSPFYADDFIRKVAILIELMVNDWDSSGEWSHYASKDKPRRASSEKDKDSSSESHSHLYPKDRHEDFHRLMNSFNDDESSPRRSSPRLRKLSGKMFMPDFHSAKDRHGGKPPSWFPAKSTVNQII
ncbi:hypothetical protein CVT25_015372 [Psilocybe cyanescens]|uniref:Uncharacterized protein n=1 Tax=Psilocybe cyanescens TaxID=93625 RepID=A0A409WHC0_PSICY|nr:hypothetical protein CVT25_015372 [Psilocybe cyanescens]